VSSQQQSAKIKLFINSNIFCIALSALLSALQAPAGAQQTAKVPRIGYLSSASPSDTLAPGAFRQALRELGYVEGKNIVIEQRYAELKLDRLPDLAAELVRLKVDIIVAAGGIRAIGAAKNATETIPIVMGGSGIDPVVAGLVESLARPGRNVTGITNLTRELGGKRLELLKEAGPNIARVAVLYESANPGSLRELKEILPAAARALGLTVRSWEIPDADGFEKVFAALNKERPDGLYVTTSPLMTANVKRSAGFALKSRLPSVGSNTYLDAGGLLSYDTNIPDSQRRVAVYVDKILKGSKPGDLPVEQPTKFEMAMNLKTAKQIGVTIPHRVLARADRVIK
jgi:putative tryptophan/tyrosine transport system substrate-binding protein